MAKPLFRCSACFAKDNPKVQPVPGDGPMDSSVLLVGEGPGKYENNVLHPFVGKTGEELNNTYLPIAGLNRYQVRCTNTFRCKYADSSDTPDPEVIRVCAETHLKPEIEAVDPEIIVLMGGIANSLIGVDIDTVHGTGRNTKLFGKSRRIFSVYHPALGLHKSSAMQSLLDDFRTLRSFITGDTGVLVDALPHPKYIRLRTAREVDEAFGGYYDQPLAIDTESRKTWNGYRPTIRYIGWCLTACHTPGVAYMIREVDKEAVKRFAYHVRRYRLVLMHNAPHDMKVLWGMEVYIDWDRVIDTMSMSYNEARLPKGLKPLSYQLLGAIMRNFEDVVLPYGRKRALEFIEKVSWEEWPEPEQEWTGEWVEKKCPDCKGKQVIGSGRGKKRVEVPCKTCDGGIVTVKKMTRKQGIKQKISRLITDLLKNPELDVWKRWENWELDVQTIIDRMGPLPLPSVEMVPEEEILDYAGSDAHSTRRIYPVLLKRLVDIRRRYEQASRYGKTTTVTEDD